MFLYYIFRNVILNLIRKQSYKDNDIYKGFKLYMEMSTSEKKSIGQIFFECEKLSYLWKCFPDTYFRYGMFLKNFSNYDVMKSFVPQISYGRYVNSLPHNSKYNILIDDKILYHDIMNYYHLPVPKRYFIFRNNVFMKDGIIIDDNTADKILLDVKDDRIFVKKHSGGAASGIFVYTKQYDGYYCKDEKLSTQLIRSKFKNQNVIFEKQIVQEPILSSLNPDTVNTIRILTKKDKIIAACVRIGRKGAFVDNASVGGLVINVDVETGILNDYAMRFYDLNCYYEHPDTNVRFSNIRIPDWDSIKELVYKTLRLFPYYASVGFDIATTDNGPVVIEINTGAGINCVQIGCKKGLADRIFN